MQQEGDYDSKTFATKALNFNVKGIWTWSELKAYIKTVKDLVFGFKNLPFKEIVAVALGYSGEDWTKLKELDTKYGTKVVPDLVEAFEALVGAFGVPTSGTEIILTLAGGPLGKLAGRIGKGALNKLLKASPAEAKTFFSGIKNELNTLKDKALKKRATKTPAKVVKNAPCFKTKAFSTESVFDLINCPEFLKKLDQFVINGKQNGTLKKVFKEHNGFYPPAQILEHGLSKNGTKRFNLAFNKYKHLPDTDPRKKILLKIKNISEDFSKPTNKGVPIRKLKTKDIYTPNMSPYKIFDEVKVSSNTFEGGLKKVVGGDKDYISASQVLYQSNAELRSVFSSPKELQKFFKEAGVTWHHVEDIDTMILVPEAIHAGLGHFGASSLIKNMGDSLENWKALVSLGY